MQERRRHIRIRPTAELPVQVQVVVGGDPRTVQVIDVSTGGLGIYRAAHAASLAVGDRVQLTVTLGRTATFDTLAEVRHTSGAGDTVCGLSFVDLADEAKSAMRRYFAELFERGGGSV